MPIILTIPLPVKNRIPQPFSEIWKYVLIKSERLPILWLIAARNESRKLGV
ncbi:MAG: hypothetical protein PHY78_13695 [Desulfobacterales bacterium]|nr:hypothetical protein [Desulfobacterales bacterium]